MPGPTAPPGAAGPAAPARPEEGERTETEKPGSQSEVALPAAALVPLAAPALASVPEAGTAPDAFVAVGLGSSRPGRALPEDAVAPGPASPAVSPATREPLERRVDAPEPVTSAPDTERPAAAEANAPRALEPVERPASAPPHQALPAAPQAPVAEAPAAGRPDIPVASGVPVAAVPVEIGLRSLAGTNRFDIRLAPEDLGRVEVSLEIRPDGAVTARLVVERPETLAALQREAPQLERALEQAGLKTQEASVELSLRDPAGEGAGGQRGGTNEQPGRQAQPGPTRDRAGAPAEAMPVLRQSLWTRASGIDVRI